MIDRHHILFERSTWISNPQAKNLRNTQSLVPRIDRGVHEEIHHNVPMVPLLGRQAMFKVVNLFEPSGHTLEDIDLLARSIERATRQGPPIERELGGLAIETLMQQKYILRSNFALVTST